MAQGSTALALCLLSSSLTLFLAIYLCAYCEQRPVHTVRVLLSLVEGTKVGWDLVAVFSGAYVSFWVWSPSWLLIGGRPGFAVKEKGCSWMEHSQLSIESEPVYPLYGDKITTALESGTEEQSWGCSSAGSACLSMNEAPVHHIHWAW